MESPTFSGRTLDVPILHTKSTKLWISCLRLPAQAGVVGNITADADRNSAGIGFFASTLRDSAMLWFNSLTINIDPVVAPAPAIGTLDALCTAFQAQFLFDPSQKWRYLTEFSKIKQTPGEKVEDFIQRMQMEAVRWEAATQQNYAGIFAIYSILYYAS